MVENKKYIIPVEWTVYSTVVVKGAETLEEARQLVEANIADIPLSRNPNYVDESYKISADCDEDLEAAQGWQTRGVLMTKDNDKIDYQVID